MSTHNSPNINENYNAYENVNEERLNGILKLEHDIAIKIIGLSIKVKLIEATIKINDNSVFIYLIMD